MDGKKKWPVLAGAVLVLAGLAYLLWRTGFFEAVASPAELEAYIERFAPYSQIVFFLLQLTTVVLAPIPSNITAAAGGVLFGTAQAFLLTIGAVILGSCIVFLLARWLGKNFAEQFVSGKVSEKYLHLIRTKRDTFLTLTLLFPFFPDDLLCILAGLTDIPFRRYLIILVLTRPWGLLAASALGGSALSIPLPGMAVLGVVGLGLFLLGMKYGDRIEANLIKRFQKK